MKRRHAHDLIFKLEHQFTLYLQRAGVTASQLPADQYCEMRRAFYGGCGQMFFLMSQDVTECGSDEAMGKVLRSFQDQIGSFWEKETALHKLGMVHLHPTTPAKCECGWEGQVEQLKHPEKGTSGKLRCPKCDSETVYFKASKP